MDPQWSLELKLLIVFYTFIFIFIFVFVFIFISYSAIEKYQIADKQQSDSETKLILVL